MPSSNTFVGVVFGGASREHNVSIQSATTVIKALRNGDNANRFKIKPIYIDLDGRWWPEEIANQALKKGYALQEKELPTPLPPHGFNGLPNGTNKVEVWYPVLHGPNGEDGTIQGVFTLMRKPFVGSGVLASATGMDKLAMKAAFSAAGLPQVPYFPAEAKDLTREGDKEKLLKKLELNVGYPCFVKPANLGSSVGITKALNRKQLIEGLMEAAKLDRRIVIEKAVIARELECAVLGGSDSLKTSAVGEIRFDADWYDYETKYSQNSSQALIPAPLPAKVKDRVQQLTLQACEIITAKGLARVDFFYKEETDELWINEINTLPGFTSKSMYPMLWEAAGVTLEQLVATLVATATE
ncbi:D-alanine--D-alanine ligase family protein [Prochlorococcus sp. MIT 1307]|uniref:D-alanine--D-alanine ligase family protein n=1 Tax=Prochlorococcus sp. MIT 1307 TaxID=3096219 RepID=UPI002A75C6B9|nr:D-alanine--D-alanine ligase family protein [Prochlorococcus sp. MIT 1307]